MPTFSRRQTFPGAIKQLDFRIKDVNRRLNRYQLQSAVPADNLVIVAPSPHTNDAAWTNQRVYFVRFVPTVAFTVRYIRPTVTVAGSATNSTFQIGVYDGSGSLLSSTGDLVQATNVTGPVALSLTTTVDVDAGQAYWAACLVKSQSGTPQYAHQSQAGVFWNINQYATTAGTLRDAMVQGGRTSMPSDMSGATTFTAGTSSSVPVLIIY